MKAFNLSALNMLAARSVMKMLFNWFKENLFHAQFSEWFIKKKKSLGFCQMFSAFSVIIIWLFLFSYFYDN